MNAQTLTEENSMCTDLLERKGFMVLDLLLFLFFRRKTGWEWKVGLGRNARHLFFVWPANLQFKQCRDTFVGAAIKSVTKHKWCAALCKRLLRRCEKNSVWSWATRFHNARPHVPVLDAHPQTRTHKQENSGARTSETDTRCVYSTVPNALWH